ncbi:hypothetical protein ACFV98_11840 [Streptomyces violascens]|uniref:hypothetical protein n=1 Tax=Streptomyces violascens TaxID=67381 RepID=UPI003661C304
MGSRESYWDSLKGGGFVKGSAAGLGEMFLGWRSMLLGCGGTVGGLGGVITQGGIAAKSASLGIGCAPLALALVTWKHMKRQQNDQ